MTNFGVRTDRTLIRAAANSIRYALVEIEAPRVERTGARPPVNLAFVLDRSGSMSGAKIGTAKLAIQEALGRLEPGDRFSVVVYDDHIDIVAETLEATPANRRAALEALAGIEARGSTNLGEGWLRGAEQVALHLVETDVNRVLLLTDGLANKGITGHDELVRHATELRARGVQTTTFGVGADFDEALLQAMADAGGGHFYFIADAAQIRDAITSEVGETLEIAARDVRVEVTVPEGVSVRSLTPHPFESRGARSSASIGDLVSGQEVAVVLSLRFPTGDVGREIGALISVVDRDGVLAVDPAALAWQYADHAANDTQPRDRDVDRAVARLYAATARQEAVRYNRAGDYDEARRQLRGVRRRVEEYAGRDTELRLIVNSLAAEEDLFAEAMAPRALKEAHYSASIVSRSRRPDGSANRREQV